MRMYLSFVFPLFKFPFLPLFSFLFLSFLRGMTGTWRMGCCDGGRCMALQGGRFRRPCCSIEKKRKIQGPCPLPTRLKISPTMAM